MDLSAQRRFDHNLFKRTNILINNESARVIETSPNIQPFAPAAGVSSRISSNRT